MLLEIKSGLMYAKHMLSFLATPTAQLMYLDGTVTFQVEMKSIDSRCNGQLLGGEGRRFSSSRSPSPTDVVPGQLGLQEALFQKS